MNPLSRPAPIDGVEISRARNGRGRVKQVGRIALWALVLIVGFNGVLAIAGRIGNKTEDTAPAAVEGITPAQAAETATRFAADYLSHDPTTPQETGGAWQGIGWSAADLVFAGSVQITSPNTAVAAVTARVDLGMPTSTSSAPAQQTTAPKPGAAHSATLPKGYQSAGSVWLPLLVPVTLDTDGQATAGPPVFSADSPTPAPTAAAIDTPVTATTKEYAQAFMTAYGASDTTTQYLTSPGVVLRGLGGVVEPGADLPAWTLSVPDPAGVRTGSVTVVWSFAPQKVDLTVKQTYDVTVTATAGGRWFANGITPHTTTTPEGTA